MTTNILPLLLQISPEFKKLNPLKDSFEMKGAGNFLILKIKKANGVKITSILVFKDGEYKPYDRSFIRVSTSTRVKIIKDLLKYGFNKPEISEILDVSLMTIHRDLRVDAKDKAEE